MEPKGLAQKVLFSDESREHPKLEYFIVNKHGRIESTDERTAIESVFFFGNADAIMCRGDMGGNESFIMLGNNTYTGTKFERMPRLKYLTEEDIAYLSEKTGLPLHELVEVYSLSKK